MFYSTLHMCFSLFYITSQSLCIALSLSYFSYSYWQKTEVYTWYINTYRSSFIYWFNYKFLVIKWNVPNFTPWKTYFWWKSENKNQYLQHNIQILVFFPGDKLKIEINIYSIISIFWWVLGFFLTPKWDELHQFYCSKYSLYTFDFENQLY